MSDTKIGRSSVRTAHGLSRFGRSTRDDVRGTRSGHARSGIESGGIELLEAAADLIDTTEADLIGSLRTDVEQAPSPLVGSADVLTIVPDALPEASFELSVPALVREPAAPRSTWPALPVALPGAALVGFAAALVVGAPVVPALVVAAVWLTVALHLAPARRAPGAAAWQGLLQACVASVAAAGLTVGLVGAPRVAVAASLTLAVSSSLAAVALRQIRRIPRRRIIVVGGGHDVASAAARWLGHHEVQVVGAALTEHAEPAAIDALVELGVPLQHGTEDFGRLLDETNADLVVLGPTVDQATLRQVSWQVEGRPVGLAVTGALDAVSPHRLRVSSFAGATLTHVSSSRPTVSGLVVKNAMDRLAGLALVAVAAPVIGILALLIRLDSPGPVFFRQTRVGHHGRLFTMWKLRTMVVDAERIKATLAAENQGSGLLFKMAADPRVTKVGRVLRKCSLDELPQLINVVLGQMSLVGPRPALPSEVAAYDAVTRRRLAAKPGITGLWQVSGRSDLSWDEAVRLDLHYTDNWRVRDDASILFRTAGAVLASRGAY